MRMNLIKIIYFLFCFLFAQLVWAQADREASVETKALFSKLKHLAQEFRTNQKILIGHQDAFVEGKGWRLNNSNIGEELKSDMEEVSGVHPAVFGVDLLHVNDQNEDLFVYQINEVHNRGGVVTLSWHMPTIIDDGIGDNSYKDKSTKVVPHIIPGGYAHEKYKVQLAQLIKFLKRVSNVPIIFRPFHEHNGSWFWWGRDHSTITEYVTLWRFTIDYLKQHNIHHLLYAYSPTHVKRDYYERYPGDDYVDVLGVDMYFNNPLQDVTSFGLAPLDEWRRDVLWLMSEATKKDKLAAVTEFGQESVVYKDFWTKYMEWPVNQENVSKIEGRFSPDRGLSYIMLWRNDRQNPRHYFGPIIGNRNTKNFKDMLKSNIFQGIK